MEENRDVYDARMRCITFPLGLNFCCVFSYEEWITSRVDDYIFLSQSSEFVRNTDYVTERRAVISSEEHFVSNNLATIIFMAN